MTSPGAMIRPAAVFVLTVGAAAVAQGESRSFALLSLQDRVADPAIAASIEAGLRRHLELRGEVADRERVRTTLRRHRIRRLDDATPQQLAGLAGDLGVDWLISPTLHEAQEDLVTVLTLSARATRGGAEPESRSAFVSATGIDRLRLLGLGEITQLPDLAELQIPRLLDRLSLGIDPSGQTTSSDRRHPAWPRNLGAIAVLPLTSPIAVEAAAGADAGTEALYAALDRLGALVVPPSSIAEMLRRQRVRRWGELDAAARATIARESGARLVLTGSVEGYEVSGGLEPQPRVTVALRALDAETGRIVWHGALERTGWYRQRLFRRGRLYSRGQLLEELLQRLIFELIEAVPGLDLEEAAA